jgi:DNA polymerase
MKLVQPEVVVCLGATAAQALLGKTFRVTKSRGQRVSAPFTEAVFATVHPSSILRAPDSKSRDEARKAFVADLKKVSRFLAKEERAEREVRRRVAPTRAD